MIVVGMFGVLSICRAIKYEGDLRTFIHNRLNRMSGLDIRIPGDGTLSPFQPIQIKRA